MKARIVLFVIILILASCSKKPEVVEGPLTRELLQRHIDYLGSIRYSSDSSGKIGRSTNQVSSHYYWKFEDVIEIKQQTSISAEILVRVKGHQTRLERRRGRRGTTRIEYGHATRSATWKLSRSSPDDFWRIDEPYRVLKLKTGPYVEPAESEKLVPIAKPVSAPEEPETSEPPIPSPPPEPRVEPQVEPLEEIEDVTPELNMLKTQLASLRDELTVDQALDYPDTVVTKTGHEMECDILDETETSIRIKTSSGTASMPKNRIESIRYATESEKSQALEAIAKNKEIRRQMDDIALKITAIEGTHKEALDKRQTLRGEELLDYAKGGHEGLVSRFLDAGMGPDVRDHNRRTPLMLAAFEGHNGVVTALLDAGADLKAKDVDGWTALMYAAYGGRVETARLLIDRGADVNARVGSGQSVLTIAKQKGHQDIVNLLLQTGAR